MSYELRPQTAQFQMGISTTEQLVEWFDANPHVPKILFAGRSNVGKSSLINSIFGSKTARTSKTAGRTREVNVFSFPLFCDGKRAYDIPEFYFLDIPGYGHAEVNPQMKKKWNMLMGMLFEQLGTETLIINIQDARHPMQEADLEFKQFAKKMLSPQILVFNKMDKLKTQKERAELQKLQTKVSKEFKHCKQIYYVSAESKKGLPELSEGLINFLLKSLPR